MRIRTDGKFERRADTMDEIKDRLGCSSRTEAIMLSLEHVRRDRRAKEKAVEYMARELPPEKAQELAEILSTSSLQLEIDVETAVGNFDE